jgi:ribonuclease HII
LQKREGIVPLFFSMDTFEKIAYQEGYQFIAGIDEAGRGPLAGPVVAAAVIFPPGYVNAEINDSKKLSAHKREELYEIIKSDAVAIGMSVVDADIIDQLNILRALFRLCAKQFWNFPLPPIFF